MVTLGSYVDASECPILLVSAFLWRIVFYLFFLFRIRYAFCGIMAGYMKVMQHIYCGGHMHHKQKHTATAEGIKKVHGPFVSYL